MTNPLQEANFSNIFILLPTTYFKIVWLSQEANLLECFGVANSGAPLILLTPFQNERQFHTVSCIGVKHKQLLLSKLLETSKLHMAKNSCVSDDV